MIFHPIFENHCKKYALDWGTITYLNARIVQFLGSPMDNRLSLAFKRYEFESVTAMTFFCLFFSIYLFVCSFFSCFVHKWIFHYESAQCLHVGPTKLNL